MILTKEYIDNFENMAMLDGTVMISEYQIKETKNNTFYIDGFLLAKSKIPFKIWTGELFQQFRDNDMTGKIGYVSAKINIYNEQKSLILYSFTEDNTLDAKNYFILKYSDEKILDMKRTLIDMLYKNLSPEGYHLIDKILLSNNELMDKFCSEFAAKSHHDNTYGGLLAHTWKMLYFGITTTQLFHSLWDNDSKKKDLFLIGILLHDLGKVKEMHYGEYQQASSITHRYLGIRMLLPYESEIVQTYDQKWFDDLLSILIQHHHCFEEKARTLPAYLVYLIDSLESQLTTINDKIDNETKKSPHGDMIWLDKETPLYL